MDVWWWGVHIHSAPVYMGECVNERERERACGVYAIIRVRWIRARE